MNSIGALEFAQTKLSDYGKMGKYNEKLEVLTVAENFSLMLNHMQRASYSNALKCVVDTFLVKIT